jgi:hypothetical protein
MKTWILKPCLFKELAALYGLSERVFRKHLEPIKEAIGKKVGYFYTIRQILIIFDKLGPPSNIHIVYPGRVS